MHASFVETFAPAAEYANQSIVASTAAVTGSLSAGNVEVKDKLCVGSVCVDTVAFGQILRASAQVKSLSDQTLATAVFMVNSMMGNMTLLPNQSVISLTYVGGDYANLTKDPTGSASAEFAKTVASAVKSAIGAFPKFSSAADATAAFLKTLSKNPVPSWFIDPKGKGITGVTGADVTNTVASHLAVFATWSSVMPQSEYQSALPSSSSSSSSSNETTVYAVSVTDGSIVVNLLVTYPSNFTV